MKKTKQIIAALSAAAMLFSMSVQGVLADTYISKNFDENEKLDQAGVFGGEIGSGFWGDLPNEKHTAGFAQAPKADTKRSTLTTEGTDMAAKIGITASGSSGTPSMQLSAMPSGLYEKGAVRISFNVYVNNASGSNYAPIQVGLRTKGDSKEKAVDSTLVAFRANKNMQINGSSSYQSSYAFGKWYHLTFDIDTVNKTYIPYLDGEKLYSTPIAMVNKDKISFESNAGAAQINAVRFYVNNGNNSTGCLAYFDDLYVGDVVSNSTDKLVIDAFHFSDGAGSIKEITTDTDAVYAQATVTYSEKTPETPVQMYAALYGADLTLKGVCKTEETIPTASEEGDFKKDISMKVEFAEPYEAGDGVMLYLWDGGMKPLAAPTGLNVKNGAYFFDQSFTGRTVDAGEIKPMNLGTEGEPHFIPSVTNELGDVQGYAYKMDCPLVPSSSTPYINIYPKGVSGDTVNIAFKLYQNTAHPKLLEVSDASGARSELLTFRPTGDIQIGGKSVGHSYTENIWTAYRFELNTVDKTYVVYQNGEQIATESYTVDFASLRFTVQYNKNNVDGKSVIYIDDIKVY